ncbi:efflux transporter outer membrane subunit [soil metagenome]
MKKIRNSLWACLCLPLVFAGCATSAPPRAIDDVRATAPAQWNAPLQAAASVTPQSPQLPHAGAMSDLSRWWQQQGDPLLVELIDAAQAASATVAAAASRIAQARAAGVAAGAAMSPKLDLATSAARTSTQPPLPLGTTVQAALQASWEVDLFGGLRAARDAAQARLEGAQAGWHDARVSVAAETASQYFALRACERQAAILQAEATSRGETSRLSELSANAGFLAPATAALARASAAEGSGRATQQRAQCELNLKALVMLTALPEADLRARIAGAPSGPLRLAGIAIDSLPAQTLAQRPDLFAAERNVTAASADVGAAQAQRYPRLGLNGSIGAASFRSDGVTTNLSTWSIGPLALTVPLFDGGARAANVDAAQARYDEAVINYRALARQAVREVEEALVRLQSVAAREADARIAAEGYRASFNGTESRYQNGMSNLVELEDARRTRLAAELALVTLEQERVAAWIALYRAAGGGWNTAAQR